MYILICLVDGTHLFYFNLTYHICISEPIIYFYIHEINYKNNSSRFQTNRSFQVYAKLMENTGNHNATQAYDIHSTFRTVNVACGCFATDAEVAAIARECHSLEGSRDERTCRSLCAWILWPFYGCGRSVMDWIVVSREMLNDTMGLMAPSILISRVPL